MTKYDRYKHVLKGGVDKCGQIYCPTCNAFMTPKEWFGDD